MSTTAVPVDKCTTHTIPRRAALATEEAEAQLRCTAHLTMGSDGTGGRLAEVRATPEELSLPLGGYATSLTPRWPSKNA
jgi:hypothetical protein